jgi:hypothetical protein
MRSSTRATSGRRSATRPRPGSVTCSGSSTSTGSRSTGWCRACRPAGCSGPSPTPAGTSPRRSTGGGWRPCSPATVARHCAATSTPCPTSATSRCSRWTRRRCASGSSPAPTPRSPGWSTSWPTTRWTSSSTSAATTSPCCWTAIGGPTRWATARASCSPTRSRAGAPAWPATRATTARCCRPTRSTSCAPPTTSRWRTSGRGSVRTRRPVGSARRRPSGCVGCPGRTRFRSSCRGRSGYLADLASPPRRPSGGSWSGSGGTRRSARRW